MCQAPAHVTLPDGAIIMTGCDCAITSAAPNAPVVYSYELLVAHFRDHDGMSEEEAIEYIDYNCVRALPYYGAAAPRIVDEEGHEYT